MNKHRKQRKCKVCNKCFRDLHTLTTHLRTHTGSRPFSCTLCAKSFREKYKLDQHLKQHRGDDTVKCDICGKVLSTTFNLKIHLEMHKKKTHCELCGETFTTKSELIKHLETDSETCGASIKPKLRKRRAPKKSKKREASPLPVKEEFIKTEPEFYFPSENVFEMSHVEAVPKEEQEDTPDEIDIIN
ncbi:hypothetical protein NQ318_011236 [Aromia moschata]|uniref:C2H2-type domain-containing protein n=1 Tax=Aromia moschata TaxID=1265417 RepID=A0AAV8YJQ9_9CUCU|nr:hypothetical protein NQ318_011236 [Aromia moschata]